MAAAMSMIECPSCGGDGQMNGADCPTCDGEGEVPLRAARDISQKQRDDMNASDFAGKGTSYPIKKPEDVSAAANSIGRAGPGNYSSDKLKANIIRIAKRKGGAFVAALPDSWKKEMKMAGEHLRDLHLLRATGSPHAEMIDGRTHLIVPCVALMETVIHAVNSEIAELVPLATLKEAAESWNGKPVLLGHPVFNGKQLSANAPGVFERSGLGMIRNARVQGKKLCMDACLDPDLVKKVGGEEFLSDLQAGKRHIELSVGAYAVTELQDGTFDGKSYKAVWQGARGDHLALLPNSRGACSVETGCGTHRAAEYYVAAEEFRAATQAELESLGDVTGHEFHGNQWSAGSPGGTTGQKLEKAGFKAYKAGEKLPHVGVPGIDKVEAGHTAYVKTFSKEEDAVKSQNAFHYHEHPGAVSSSISSPQRSNNFYPGHQHEVIVKNPSKQQKLLNDGTLRAACGCELEPTNLLGKRHSQKDTEIIQGVHDHAVSLGASCPTETMKGAEARYLSDSLMGDSLNTRMQEVMEAVRDKYNSAPVPTPTPVDQTPYTFTEAVYDDHVIIRQDDDLFSVDYTVGADGDVVLKDKMTAVKQAYVAAEATPDTIRMEGGRWTVYNMEGTRRLGSHATREEAEVQQRAIARSLARQRTA